MGSYRRQERDNRIVARCTTCHAAVLSHIDHNLAGADIVCATCGMTIFDSPLQSDYFEVAMKIHRRGPAPRPHRS